MQATIETREEYPRSLIWTLLREYQRRAQGARLPAREEKLGTRPPPLEEAPTAVTSRLWCDLERAMQKQPFERMQITFMVVCMGNSSWRTGEAQSWRSRIADWWGLTPGEVNDIVDETVEALHAWVNARASEGQY